MPSLPSTFGASGPQAALRPEPPTSVDATLALLDGGRYVADRNLGTALFLSLKLGRPLLLEGDAGVGKTEVAKVLASALDRRLIRLQCYEGLDVASAVYEWNYARQMLEIRLAEVSGVRDRDAIARDVFSAPFLVKRPLLQALEPGEGGPPVLLIDELDRADEPFEAYLLEVLSDFQITVPEIGVFRAPAPPIVIVTSNRTREIHDALKRRCFYHFIGYPDAARELAILQRRIPDLPAILSRQVVGFVQRLRALDLFKAPGVAETIDWMQALLSLDRVALDPETVDATLGVVLKYQDDIAKIAGKEARTILSAVEREGAAG
jgi:MoxR-like ATPase